MPLADSCIRNRGRPAWVPINNSWEYDPAADTWKALAPMPSKRGSPVAVTVGDKMYVIGGAGNIPGSTETKIDQTTPQMVFGTVEEYDPGEEYLARAESHAHTAQPYGRRCYQREDLCGRRQGGSSIHRACVGYFRGRGRDDPATDKWSAPRSRMPTARSALGAGVYGGRMYVAGGEFQDPHMMATFRAVEAYDPRAIRGR